MPKLVDIVRTRKGNDDFGNAHNLPAVDKVVTAPVRLPLDRNGIPLRLRIHSQELASFQNGNPQRLTATLLAYRDGSLITERLYNPDALFVGVYVQSTSDPYREDAVLGSAGLIREEMRPVVTGDLRARGVTLPIEYERR